MAEGACPGLSAGRVQSVATRLVVDRERERIAFRVASYWDLEGTFDAGAEHDAADVPGAGCTRVDGTRVASGRDFGRDGKPVARFDGVHLDQADRPRRWPTALRGHGVRRPLGRGQALPPLARTRRSDHDAAAGGQPQAAA